MGQAQGSQIRRPRPSSHPSTKGVLFCPNCNKAFATRQSLSIHYTEYPEHRYTSKLPPVEESRARKSLENRPFYCTTCKQDFVGEDGLRRHRDLVHKTTPSEYYCKDCLRHFAADKDYRNHRELIHNEAQPVERPRSPGASTLERHATSVVDDRRSSLQSHRTVSSYKPRLPVRRPTMNSIASDFDIPSEQGPSSRSLHERLNRTSADVTTLDDTFSSSSRRSRLSSPTLASMDARDLDRLSKDVDLPVEQSLDEALKGLRDPSPTAVPRTRLRRPTGESPDSEIDIPSEFEDFSGDDPYPTCETCKQTFPSFAALKTHRDREHATRLERPRSPNNPGAPLIAKDEIIDEDEETYCNVCEEDFSSGLSKHLLFAAKHAASTAVPGPPNVLEQARSFCSFCNVYFPSRGILTKHTRDANMHNMRDCSRKNATIQSTPQSNAPYKLTISTNRPSGPRKRGTPLRSNSPGPVSASSNAASRQSLGPLSSSSSADPVSSRSRSPQSSHIFHLPPSSSIPESTPRNYITTPLRLSRLSSPMSRPPQDFPYLDPIRDTLPASRPLTPPATATSRSASPVTPSSEYECPLCFERGQGLSSIKCGHVFCTECIKSVLQKDPRCPVCRDPTTVDDVRKVFLISA